MPFERGLASQLSRPWIGLSFVAAVTFVLYYGTLSFEFVWDDVYQVVNNPLIRSWHSIPRAFVSHLWFHTTQGQVYYRPLFIISEIVSFKLFGLKTWGWHLMTIFFHVLASCMVYWLARSLKLDHWTSVLGALIFGIHPIHVECASWISAASESMVSVFYMLAFVTFVNARERSGRDKRKWQVLSCAVLACALLTKEMAISFALVVALYEWLARDGEHAPLARIRHCFVAAVPYVALTLGYFLLRRMVLHQNSVFDPTHTNLDVILTLPIILFTYLKLLLLPIGITAVYYIPYVTSPGLWTFVLPLLALLVALAILLYWSSHRSDSSVVFLTGWLLLGLMPVMYLRLFSPGAGVRDRYIYLPSVGFALLLAMAIRSIRIPHLKNRETVQLAISAAVTLALFAGSLMQQVYWSNDLLLFYRAYSLYPESAFAALDLSDALIGKRQYGRAIPILNQIVQDHPDSGKPHYYLARTYLRMGQKEDARRELEAGLNLEPDLMRSETGMSDIASLYAQLGDYQKAIDLFNQVLRQEPDLYEALYNGGYTYFLMDNDRDAETLLLRAARIAPDLAPPVFYLGRIALRTGRPELAETYFTKTLQLDAKGYDFHYWLGRALATRGQISRAEIQYREELKLYPQNPNAIAELRTDSEPH